jgi:hypothetical protein
VRRDQVHSRVQVEYRSSINSYIYIYIYIYICELILGSPMSILYKKIPEVITFYLQQKKKKTRRLVTTLSLHYLINDKVELLITIHIITIF